MYLGRESKTWGADSIAIYSGKPLKKWGPEAVQSGLGGSESAVLYLSKYWVRKGYQVTIFGYFYRDEPEFSAEFEGSEITFADYQTYSRDDQFNILILVRGSSLTEIPTVKPRLLIADLHDMPSQSFRDQNYADLVDYMMVKGEFHKAAFDGLARSDEYCEQGNMVKISNGGAYDEYLKQYSADESAWKSLLDIKDKNWNKLIWTSSYDRGLHPMLKYAWPILRKTFPEAQLHVYYGWEVFDAIYGNDMKNNPTGKMAGMKRELMSFFSESNGVFEHGCVSHAELKKNRLESNIHWYTGHFPEIDCISVRESASAGTVSIVSDIAAFRDGAKDYLHKIEGDPQTVAYYQKAGHHIGELMQDRETLNGIRKHLFGSESLHFETWESVAERWSTYFALA